MSQAAIVNPPFLETYFPTWFAHPPEKYSASYPIKGAWATVHLYKLLHKGDGRGCERRYTLEVSTGDLYGIPEKEPLKPYAISVKCASIFLATIPYTVTVMACNMMKLVADITALFWKVIPQMLNHPLPDKPILAALADEGMEILFQTLGDIKRIVASPIFAVGMLFAASLGIICPQEGRKWLGKIECEWHEGADDPRRKKPDVLEDSFTPSMLVRWAREGKVIYLGYCMIKRGNINDQIHGKQRFTFEGDKQ